MLIINNIKSFLHAKEEKNIRHCQKTDSRICSASATDEIETDLSFAFSLVHTQSPSSHPQHHSDSQYRRQCASIQQSSASTTLFGLYEFDTDQWRTSIVLLDFEKEILRTSSTRHFQWRSSSSEDQTRRIERVQLSNVSRFDPGQ